MGALKLKQYFFRHHQVIVPQKRLYFFLRDEGILAARAKAGKKTDEGEERRFEYPVPMAAVQLDLLQLRLRDNTKLYLVTFLDDHSRFVLHSRLIPVKEMAAVIKQLTKTVVETALSTAGPAPPHLRVSPRRRPVPGVGDEDR